MLKLFIVIRITCKPNAVVTNVFLIQKLKELAELVIAEIRITYHKKVNVSLLII